MNPFTLADYQEAAQYILNQHPNKPEVGIVLGSGLGRLAESIENPTTIPYCNIPHFKTSTATGHKGNLIVGTLAGKTVVAMQGRFHYYEGYAMQEVTFPIRVMKCLGVKTLMVSNAAGGMNSTFCVGDLMLITDHINFMPNPLIGKNIDELGPRFPDMTEPYSNRLQSIARNEASRLGIDLKEGVYVAETGPTYETRAEYKMYSMLGGDAVGMSTVPEVIVARHCGIEVIGMSVITNCAHELGNGVVNDGNDVVVAADKAADRMCRLFKEIISKL